MRNFGAFIVIVSTFLTSGFGFAASAGDGAKLDFAYTSPYGYVPGVWWNWTFRMSEPKDALKISEFMKRDAYLAGRFEEYKISLASNVSKIERLVKSLRAEGLIEPNKKLEIKGEENIYGISPRVRDPYSEFTLLAAFTPGDRLSHGDTYGKGSSLDEALASLKTSFVTRYCESQDFSAQLSDLTKKYCIKN